MFASFCVVFHNLNVMDQDKNSNIIKVLNLTNEMIELANQGDHDRCDPTCGTLFGVLRDSAYKLRNLAEKEIEIHRKNGLLDSETPFNNRS